MKIWIENRIGYLEGYSTMEQPDNVELEVKKEPFDFMNWRYDGAQLIHDPENAPQPEPTPPTDIEVLQAENAELKQLNSKLMVNDVNLKRAFRSNEKQIILRKLVQNQCLRLIN